MFPFTLSCPPGGTPADRPQLATGSGWRRSTGLAPTVVHTGAGSMVDFYYGSGFHGRVEAAIGAALRALPAQRSCSCGHALRGAFHGTPPDWFVARQ